MDAESERREIAERIKRLEEKSRWSGWGTLFSALTLCCAIIGLIFRFQPIIQVANPPKTYNSKWTIGPAEMLSLEDVAKREGVKVEVVKEWIKDGKIDPIPLILQEENITWVISPKYHIQN
jgi:hypothetical protein